MDRNDTITGLAVCLFGFNIAFTHLRSYSTVPTCSSGTLTNVLPHRNAMPQTQDMTPHPVTVYRHRADLSLSIVVVRHTGITQLPILMSRVRPNRERVKGAAILPYST